MAWYHNWVNIILGVVIVLAAIAALLNLMKYIYNMLAKDDKRKEDNIIDAKVVQDETKWLR